jgi:hypothetical protein
VEERLRGIAAGRPGPGLRFRPQRRFCSGAANSRWRCRISALPETCRRQGEVLNRQLLPGSTRWEDKAQALKYFRLGGNASVPGYRIASALAGQLKRQGRADGLSLSIAVRSWATEASGPASRPGQHRRSSGSAFSADRRRAAGAHRHGLFDEAAAAAGGRKTGPASAPATSTLEIIESLLYYQQNRYFLAFSKFRGNSAFWKAYACPIS